MSSRRRLCGFGSARAWRLALVAAIAALSACGGGGDGAGTTLATATPIDCGANCAADALSVADVERVLSQTVVAAQARGQLATIAVTDRVGMLYRGRLIFDGTTAEAKSSDDPRVKQFVHGLTEGPL